MHKRFVLTKFIIGKVRGRVDIYRKPTYTDVTIDGSSFHPPNHKHAAIHTMIHRMVSVPLSPTAFQKEKDTIKLIAKNNSIRVDIDSIVRKKIITQALDKTTLLPRNHDKKDEKFIRLPFLGAISFKLSRSLRTFGFRPAFYSPNTIKQLLSNLKDPIPLDEKSGVYQLRYKDCPALYILSLIHISEPTRPY